MLLVRTKAKKIQRVHQKLLYCMKKMKQSSLNVKLDVQLRVIKMYLDFSF